MENEQQALNFFKEDLKLEVDSIGDLLVAANKAANRLMLASF